MIIRKCETKNMTIKIQRKQNMKLLTLTLILTLGMPVLRAMEAPLGIQVTVDQKKELLLLAMSDNDKDRVSVLIKRGAPLNITNTAGRTPLAYAAAYGHLDLAKQLIAAGADVNYGQGRALREAILHGQVPLITLLLESGADPALNLEFWYTHLNDQLSGSIYLGLLDRVTTLLHCGVIGDLDTALAEAISQKKRSYRNKTLTVWRNPPNSTLICGRIS